MAIVVIAFPGSNCDRDAVYAVELGGGEAHWQWHSAGQLPRDCQGIVLPGGFSYGDYLRSGALAAHSPVMAEVRAFAEHGGAVLGICNGFQILCEAGLLPGALTLNASRQFRCEWEWVTVASPPASIALAPGQVLRLPIAHREGAYQPPSGRDSVAQLMAAGQVFLQYCDRDGVVHERANPNGAVANIAGISNRGGNVVGMMPHPERAMDRLLGGADGRALWEAWAGMAGRVPV